MGEFRADRVPLEGTRLVEAGAGTGKTWTLVRLHRRLLLEKKIPIDRILVVTFTNAAAAELKARIREELASGPTAGSGEAELVRRALRDFDRAPISTIHGFCAGVLREEAFRSGTPLDVPLAGEAGVSAAEKARDYWVEKTFHDGERRILGEFPHPDSLADLARAVQARPELVCLPREGARACLPAWERLEARRREAREAWTAGREEILSFLKGGRLKGNRYRPEWVEGWVPKLEAALEEGGEIEEIRRGETWAGKFLPSGIQEGLRKGASAPDFPFFRAWEAFVRACKAPDLSHRPPERLLFLEGFVERLRERPTDPAVLLREGFSFLDMLLFVERALEGPGGGRLASALRERYRAALVDEFQDTDPVQYRIFRRIFGGGTPLFLVGDPKQAIYSFRGGDVFTYRTAREEAGREPETLVRNWRSDPSLVEALNTLFSRVESPFGFDWIPYREALAQAERDRLFLEGKPASGLYLLPFGGEGPLLSQGRAVPRAARAGAAWLAGFLARRPEIREEGRSRPLGPGDAAVLVRTNRQARLMVRTLAEAGLPSVLLGAASVFDSLEAEEVERLLRALVEPSRRGILAAALATGILGRRGSDLARLAEDASAWEREVERFVRWRRRALHRGFLPVFLEILEERDILGSVLGDREGERRLTNLRHLGELLDGAARERHLGLSGLTNWLARMRRDRAFRVEVGSEAEQIRLETDREAVKVVTIHKSKGLEYPLVLCPFLWRESEGRRMEGPRTALFHGRERPYPACLDLGSPRLEENEELALQEARAEGRRLFYVALTRAKHLAALLAGPVRGSGRSTAGFFLGWDGEDPEGKTLEARLREWAASGRGRVVVEPAREEPPGEAWRPDSPAVELRGRRAERILEARRRVSSFSGLAAGAEWAPPEAEGFPPAEEEPPSPAPGGEVFREPPGEPVLLHDFPAGTEAGNLFHRILERIDFGAREGWEAVVEEAFGALGFPGEWKEKVLSALERVVTTPLFAGGPALEEIPRGERLAEMEFLFPCGRGREGVTARRLSEFFRRWAGRGGIPAGYAERAASLGFRPLRGFLRGFVDLVFRWRGKWFLLDYKTNLLGPAPEDYGPEGLAAAMEEHHYHLQYLLYTSAVHLFLSRKADSYDYEGDFGGVFYLFLRGMEGRAAPGRGIFRARPPAEMVEDLLGVLETAREEEGGT